MSFEWGTIVKSINWTLVLNLINFAILLFLLKRLLFKPALEYLDRRREMIHARMQAVQADEKRAASLVAERSEVLEKTRELSSRAIEDARSRSADLVEAAKRQARAEAERIVADARLQMEQERDRMIYDLKANYADIAVLGAERVLDREVKVEDHRKLLDRLLEAMDEDVLKVKS